MVESAKTRETASPQSVLMAVADLKERLSAIFEAERLRLRMLTTDDDLSGSRVDLPACAVPSSSTTSNQPSSSSSSGSIPAYRQSATQDLKPLASSTNGTAPRPLRDLPEPEGPRPENPRRRLEELAKLLDKRAKQSAENVLKALELKEADH